MSGGGVSCGSGVGTGSSLGRNEFLHLLAEYGAGVEFGILDVDIPTP